MSSGADDIGRDIAAMALLEDVLELPSDDRLRAIDASAADDAVKAQARNLLAGYRDGAAGLRTGAALENETGSAEDAPDTIGPYRIVRQLGRGGMGTVYLAERNVGDFDHRVAIKVIRSGALSEALTERFFHERQTLAQLKHPNIAHLYDGGTTKDGAPYIVMEYVAGRRLADFVAEESPSLKRRVELMLQIIDAVAFAHRNLVIHRDLTPGNVIVDEDGAARLIDFGIARPQDVAPAMRADTTAGLSLTPGYAAPERRQSAPATTAIDVYSLGKIAQFLFAEREEDELEAIGARAAEHDPADRYPNAEAMGADLRAFGENRPVAAYSRGAMYRARKYLERNTVPVLLAGLALALLVGGLVGVSAAYREQQKALTLAEERFDAVEDLATFQLFDLYDDLGRSPGNTASRVALAEKAQAYLDTLLETRGGDPDAQLRAAAGLVRLAEIQGVPARPNLGDLEKARANLDKAEVILDRLAQGGDPRSAAGRMRIAAARGSILINAESDMDGAASILASAERLVEATPQPARDEPWHQARAMLRVTQMELANMNNARDDLFALVDESREELREWPETPDRGDLTRFYRAVATHFQGAAAFITDDVDELKRAVGYFQQAEKQFQAIDEALPNEPMALYYRAYNGYYAYAAAANSQQLPLASGFLETAIASIERLRKVDTADDSLWSFEIVLKEGQSQMLANLGKFAEAIAMQREVLDIRRSAGRGADSIMTTRDLAMGHGILGDIHRQAGDARAACEQYAISLEQFRKLDQRGGMTGHHLEISTKTRNRAAGCAGRDYARVLAAA
ncbi:serine/threonine-protein kinase [Qipengyuania sp. JC766]|uniref:serine/threonine-protein kinase n=1 Tax=Qipengyuania sp. JC766 TaxID=3232139 RepID=UPI0034582F04